MSYKLQKRTKRKVLATSILLALMLVPVLSVIFMDSMNPIGNDMSNTDGDFFEDNKLSTSAGGSTWWNYSWQYRVPINITLEDGALNDYQVKLEINLTEWIEEGYIQESGNSLRFVDSSNEEIGFWIEDMDTTGGKSTIWVRVPTISGTDTIYMYFQNPSAPSKSSIDNTMDSGLRYFYYSGISFNTY
ncbi:MAG: DUF2341 domain-containing protein, partial [Promethearchaeota archaeon]